MAGWTRQLEPVEEIPYERTLGDSAAGWFAPGDLERFTRGDVELIQRVRPDVVVQGARSLATASARAAPATASPARGAPVARP